MFATIVGLGLFLLIAGIIFFVSVIGMAASEGATASLKKGSVLRINLAGSLEERAEEDNPLTMLMGEQMAVLGLD